MNILFLTPAFWCEAPSLQDWLDGKEFNICGIDAIRFTIHDSISFAAQEIDMLVFLTLDGYPVLQVLL